MVELSDVKLRRLDITLLLVFLGLVRYRKASRVAEELGLTQSAISQSLRRLRDIFGDDLFLRHPHGMEPTSTALALEGPISSAVETLRSALSSAKAYEPMQSTRTINVVALDAAQATLIPLLAKHLRTNAPGVRLSVLPVGRAEAADVLVQGSADLALGFLWNLPDSIIEQKLYDERYLVAGPPEILIDAPTVNIDDYCAADHVLISPGGDLRGVVDEALEDSGRSRRVILGLPTFISAMAAASACDAIVTMPAQLAVQFGPMFGLVTAEPPIQIRSFPVSVFWHRRNENNPETKWFRDALMEIVPRPPSTKGPAVK